MLGGDIPELDAQLLTATVQPTHHGADGCIHDFRDVLVGKPFHIRVINHHAVILSEPHQSILDSLVGDVLQGFHLGGFQTHRIVRRRLRHLPIRHIFASSLRRPTLRLAVIIDVRVGQDAVHPRFQVGPRPE